MTYTVKELIEKLQKFATEPDIAIKDVDDKMEFEIVEVNCGYSDTSSLYNTLHIVIREKTKDEEYEDDD